MKRHLPFTLILAILFLVFQGCSYSNKMTKNGEKLEATGQYKNAAESYYAALNAKHTNVKAYDGLSRTGQKVLNDILDDFFKAHTSNDYKTATYKFIEADDYYNKLNKFNIKLVFPDHYRTDFEIAKTKYINSLYEQGTAHIENEEFTSAEAVFIEIAKLDPNFKDAEKLKNLAYLEPKYRAGEEFLLVEDFKSAYYEFEKIVERDPNYKDAKELMEQSLASGIVTVALFPFKNATTIVNVETKMSAYVSHALSNSGNPFLKIVERENIESIMKEQELIMSGVYDESTAAKIGELMGAKVALYGSVIESNLEKRPIRRTTKIGYKKYRIEKTNSEGKKYYETKYEKVNYYEFSGGNTVRVSFQYKLISLETGEVLSTRLFEDKVKDNVFYATYEGDKKNLYPSVDGKVNTSKSAKKTLDSTLGGRRQLKSTTEITNDLYKKIAKTVAGDVSTQINNY